MLHEGTGATRAPDSPFLAVTPFSFENMFIASSLLSFAIASQFAAIEVMGEMRHPEEFPKGFMSMSIPFMVVSLLVVGFGAYYFVGDQVPDMLTDNMPFGLTFQIT